MEYKIGDKVRIEIKKIHGWLYENCNNEIGVVIEIITESGYYKIKIGKYIYRFKEEEVKLLGLTNPNNDIVIKRH